MINQLQGCANTIEIAPQNNRESINTNVEELLRQQKLLIKQTGIIADSLQTHVKKLASNDVNVSENYPAKWIDSAIKTATEKHDGAKGEAGKAKNALVTVLPEKPEPSSKKNPLLEVDLSILMRAKRLIEKQREDKLPLEKREEKDILGMGRIRYFFNSLIEGKAELKARAQQIKAYATAYTHLDTIRESKDVEKTQQFVTVFSTFLSGQEPKLTQADETYFLSVIGEYTDATKKQETALSELNKFKKINQPGGALALFRVDCAQLQRPLNSASTPRAVANDRASVSAMLEGHVSFMPSPTPTPTPTSIAIAGSYSLSNRPS
jgi:hypothetical protein